VSLIQRANLDEERKQELLSLSFLVASRDVARGILLSLVREVFSMDTLPTIVEDMFGDALRKRELQSEKRGEERGEKRGEVVGALKDARTILVRLYSKRLGAPSPDVVDQLEAIDNIESLHTMIDRYDEQPESWEQLLSPVSID
jgi:hypothetical protein